MIRILYPGIPIIAIPMIENKNKGFRGVSFDGWRVRLNWTNGNAGIELNVIDEEQVAEHRDCVLELLRAKLFSFIIGASGKLVVAYFKDGF